MPEASADLKEALAWYGSIHPDLDLRFGLAVDAAVHLISQSALRFQIVHGELRRVGVKRFPYGRFFKVESHRIVVVACMHGRAIRNDGRCGALRIELPTNPTIPVNHHGGQPPLKLLTVT
jgi:hypothetical protein